MLVVSRRVGEEILVPEFGIVFRILEVRGNKIRVGITAPPEIRVQRRELYERIQAGLTTERPLPASQLVTVPAQGLPNGAAHVNGVAHAI
jgi:carbon storage regulator